MLGAEPASPDIAQKLIERLHGLTRHARLAEAPALLHCDPSRFAGPAERVGDRLDLCVVAGLLAEHEPGARRARGRIAPPAGLHRRPEKRSFPGGAHVAEVEIDPETGVIRVERYVAVDDCGRVMNHVLLEGQLHGGIVQGLGQVLGEHCIYDRASGQLLTGSFMDYFMPRASVLRAAELHDHSVPSPNNPLGAKGGGEAGTTGAVPTVANAVLDALHSLGIDRLDLPYTPAKIWHAISAAKQRKQGKILV